MASKDTNSTLITVAVVVIGGYVAWTLLHKHKSGSGSGVGPGGQAGPSYYPPQTPNIPKPPQFGASANFGGGGGGKTVASSATGDAPISQQQLEQQYSDFAIPDGVPGATTSVDPSEPYYVSQPANETGFGDLQAGGDWLDSLSTLLAPGTQGATDAGLDSWDQSNGDYGWLSNSSDISSDTNPGFIDSSNDGSLDSFAAIDNFESDSFGGDEPIDVGDLAYSDGGDFGGDFGGGDSGGGDFGD